jgi:hypothetical protein
MAALGEAFMGSVANLVPPDRYFILDYTTNAVFRRRELRPFVRKAFQLGYWRLGNIVQLPEEKLKVLVSSQGAFDKIVQTLRAIRLDIAMQAPGWVSPDDPNWPGEVRPEDRTIEAEL